MTRLVSLEPNDLFAIQGMRDLLGELLAEVRDFSLPDDVMTEVAGATAEAKRFLGSLAISPHNVEFAKDAQRVERYVAREMTTLSGFLVAIEGATVPALQARYPGISAGRAFVLAHSFEEVENLVRGWIAALSGVVAKVQELKGAHG